MPKDLTAALASLTVAAQGRSSRVDKVLPDAKPSPSIPQRSGSSGPIRGAAADATDVSFTLAGEKTLTSTDGLLSIVFQESVDMTFLRDGIVLSIGAIEKTEVSGG